MEHGSARRSRGPATATPGGRDAPRSPPWAAGEAAGRALRGRAWSGDGATLGARAGGRFLRRCRSVKIPLGMAHKCAQRGSLEGTALPPYGVC